MAAAPAWPGALATRLGVEVPIVAAPMAGGPTTVALAAEASRAGGLGVIAGAMLSPAQIREQAAALRRLTDRPFGINVFALPPAAPDAATVAAAQTRLAPFHAELGLPPPAIPNAWGEDLDAQLAAALDVAPALVSTHFGPPPPDLVAALRARGILLAVTATTAEEAVALERAGVDAIIAQGAEAGGHRGTFLAPVERSLIGTMALVPQIVDAVRVPVIAAGGIIDGRGVAAALALGAAAAQLGTAFLACPEAGTHPLHRAALAGESGTMVTRGVTGRHARGLRNRLLETLDRDAERAPDYRVQNALAAPLRAAAARQERPELMAMWAGQGHRHAAAIPAAELVRRLAADAAAILGRG